MIFTIRSIELPLVQSSALVAIAAIFAGCGNPETQRSEHSPAEGHVTFNRDVASILFQYCSGCHRPGEAGPFHLLTFQDAKKHAEQMVYVTEQRIMPPWLPEPACAEIVDELRLTDQQIETIKQWVEQGTQEGDPEDLPEMPRWTEGWYWGPPDLVIQLPEPYALQADGLDVFHTYVLPIPVSSTKYVKAVEVRPENRRIIHHALLLMDGTKTLRRMDEEHPGPGFPGTDLANAKWPEGHMPGWLPGRKPSQGRDDIAWRLEPGTDAVLQLHMLPSGKPENVQMKIGFYWAETLPTSEAVMLQLRRLDIDIPAGEKNHVVGDEVVLPVDVDVLAVQPHAHLLCTTVSGVALLPDGTEKSLMEIKQWDFNWQDSYEYVEPVFLPKGTKISMRHEFDNSSDNERNPNQPPKRVVTGWKTSDEMAELWLQLLPRDPADLAALKHYANVKRLRDRLETEIAPRRRAYRKHPDDIKSREGLADGYNAAGIAMAQVNLFQEAIGYFQQALRTDPGLLAAHQNIGNALVKLGRDEEAAEHFQKAKRRGRAAKGS